MSLKYEPSSEPIHISAKYPHPGAADLLEPGGIRDPREGLTEKNVLIGSALEATQGQILSQPPTDLRLIDSCITQLKAQGPSRTCNESKEEEEEESPTAATRFWWHLELTKETIYLPLGCLQGGGR